METINKRQHNKITTPGYFIKRLRDNGYIVNRVFQEFGEGDPRRWVVLISPGTNSVFVTCFENREFNKQLMFEFNDGGIAFPRNYSIKTESIEIVVEQLHRHNVFAKK